MEAYAREESTKGRTQTKKNSDGTYTSKEVGKNKRGNVRWVIAEAKRELDSCYHIDSPKPPLVLLGDLDQVEQEATRWAEEATDERGRKLRKDGACLLAGVISLPRDEEAKWEQFKAKSLDWLKEKYGDNLRCVIAHEKTRHTLTFTSTVSLRLGNLLTTCTKAREHRKSLKEEPTGNSSKNKT